MLFLNKVFGKEKTNKIQLTREEIIDFLQTTPEALSKFEDIYKTDVLEEFSFKVPSSECEIVDNIDLSDVVNNIVNEFQTKNLCQLKK